jgi:hypothetical protein
VFQLLLGEAESFIDENLETTLEPTKKALDYSTVGIDLEGHFSSTGGRLGCRLDDCAMPVGREPLVPKIGDDSQVNLHGLPTLVIHNDNPESVSS